MADLTPTTSPAIVDLARMRRMRNLALVYAERAAVERDPEARRRLDSCGKTRAGSGVRSGRRRRRERDMTRLPGSAA
jgi:hypothetical protein